MMPQPTKPQRKGHTAAVWALAAVLLSSGLPAASQSQAQDGPTITPNYKDADLSQIIQAVSEVTGKNFIIDPRVNAKVTMLSATPMSPAAFYEAFLAVLQVYGYVAVPAGKVIKIIPNTDQRQVPANDLPSSVSATSDEIVTQVMSLKNVSAAAAGADAAASDAPICAARRLSERQHAHHLGPCQQRAPPDAHHRPHGSKRR